jgi:hypothetical protein
MEFVKGVLDYGTAPEIHVDGTERIDLVSPGIVRVTLFTPFSMNDGTELRRAVHLLWDRHRFMNMGSCYAQARAVLANEDGPRFKVIESA